MVDVLNKIIEAKNGTGSNSADKLDEYKKNKARLEAELASGKLKDDALFLKMLKNQLNITNNAINKIDRGTTVKKQQGDTRDMKLVNELITANKKVLELMEKLGKEDASSAKNSAPRIKPKKS